MSYDFNILVLNQKKPSIFPDKASIEVRNEIESPGAGRYHTIWPYMTQAKGIWYSLAIEYCERHTAYFCHSDFEADKNNLFIPPWIDDEDVIDGLSPLLIKDEYSNDFEKIVKYLIGQSPIKTIMLLARYQSEDREIICGTFSFNEFKTLLYNEKILFNVCYIIRE